MTAGDGLVYVLLAVGVGLELLAVAGVVLMRDVYQRLHYLAPSALGAVPIAAAIWVHQGASLIALKSVLLAMVLLGGSPLLAHAIARSARIAEHGDWRRRPGEEVETG